MRNNKIYFARTYRLLFARRLKHLWEMKFEMSEFCRVNSYSGEIIGRNEYIRYWQ